MEITLNLQTTSCNKFYNQLFIKINSFEESHLDLRFFNERLDIQKFELRCQHEGRSITRFECNGEVLLIQCSKLEDNERSEFRGNDFVY